MKTFACVLLIATVVVAEPQWYRQNHRRQERSEQEPTTARPDDAPYPAAGFRPEIEFKLPNRVQVGPPATTYGVPDSSYVPPAVVNVPAETDSTEVPEPSEPTTETLTVEGLTNAKLEETPKQDATAEVISSQGAYYVLLPGSQLQRVQFTTENDPKNMAYTARLQYKNEDRAPLYIYTVVPQYRPSAALVQVSGALVEPSVPHQPSTQFNLPAVEYGNPPVDYSQSW